MNLLDCFERLAEVAFAGGERFSRESQTALNPRCDRVRGAEHASRGPFRVLECLNGLAEIVQSRAVVVVERLRVIPPHPERELSILAENALRHGNHLAQQ